MAGYLSNMARPDVGQPSPSVQSTGPLTLADQIRTKWGPLGNWNARGVDHAAALADLLSKQGVTDISGLGLKTGTRPMWQPFEQDAFAQQGEWPQNYDPNQMLPDNRLTYGDKSFGYIGSNGKDYGRIGDPSLGGGGSPNSIAFNAAGHGGTFYDVVTNPDGSFAGIRPNWESSSDMDAVRGILKGVAYVGGSALGLNAALGGLAGAGAAAGAAPVAGMEGLTAASFPELASTGVPLGVGASSVGAGAGIGSDIGTALASSAGAGGMAPHELAAFLEANMGAGAPGAGFAGASAAEPGLLAQLSQALKTGSPFIDNVVGKATTGLGNWWDKLLEGDPGAWKQGFGGLGFLSSLAKGQKSTGALSPAQMSAMLGGNAFGAGNDWTDAQRPGMQAFANRQPQPFTWRPPVRHYAEGGSTGGGLSREAVLAAIRRQQLERAALAPSPAASSPLRQLPRNMQMMPREREAQLQRYAEGGDVEESGGQSDHIPAMLSPGEYVWDADVVSALGDGDNATGAAILDEFRERLRRHKRSAPVSQIPPKARAPEDYLPNGAL